MMRSFVVLSMLVQICAWAVDGKRMGHGKAFDAESPPYKSRADTSANSLDPPPPRQALTPEEARRLLERAYSENRAAFLAKDFDRVMRQRTPDFESITPDGAKHDALESARAVRNFLANIQEWISIDFKLGEVQASAETLSVDVEQHTIRKQLREGVVRRIENWVTQRETWVLSSTGLKLRRVDSIRDQCVLVEDQLRDPSQAPGCKVRGIFRAIEKGAGSS